MKLRYAATGLFVVLSLAACQRTSYSPYSSSQQLPPLQAQPVPSVQSGELSDPSVPPGGQYPTAPAGAVASASPDAVPATAQDVTKESMVGNWRVSTGGSNCDMFLTLTNLGAGSRGGTRGCVGPLTAMGSWEVSGKQVMLKDRDGNVIGRVYKTAEARFDGTTSSGQPIGLSR